MTNMEILVAAKEISDLVNKKFPRIYFIMPDVDFFSKTATAGRAWYSENRIEFNEEIAKKNGIAFKNTVIHEISHLVTRKVYPRAKQSHGPEFRSIMSLLGGNPSTYHSYDISGIQLGTKRKVRVEVKCSCSTYWTTKAKATKCAMKQVYCKKCKDHPVMTGKTKVII